MFPRIPRRLVLPLRLLLCGSALWYLSILYASDSPPDYPTTLQDPSFDPLLDLDVASKPLGAPISKKTTGMRLGSDLAGLFPVLKRKQKKLAPQLVDDLPEVVPKRKKRPTRWEVASGNALIDTGPKDSLRTNLNQTMRYATTFMTAGWNNQVMTVFQLLHILNLLHNDPTTPQTFVPLLPPFIPDPFHLSTLSPETTHFPLLPFGKVFDLPRLAAELNMPMVEMHELKEPKPCCGETEGVERAMRDRWWVERGRDELSCWSSDMVRYERLKKGPGSEQLEDIYGLSISWTPLPPFVHVPDLTSPFLIYPWLNSFLAPAEPQSNYLRKKWLEHPYVWAQGMLDDWGRKQNNREGHGWELGEKGEEVKSVFGRDKEGWRYPEMEKNGDILCIDGLYWGSDRGGMPFQTENEFGPSVSIVPKAHWSKEIEEMAWAIVRKALGLSPGVNGNGVPHLITVHIRRGDFMRHCDKQKEECLQVKHYARKLEKVREALKKKGVHKAEVLVVTNESDPDYLAELQEIGWVTIDHEAFNTVETYGVWYPTLLDSVILTFGDGLVGTESSTMSILAAQRMTVWNPVFQVAYQSRWDVGPKGSK